MNDVFNYIWGFLFSSLAVRKEMEKKKNKPPKNLLLAEPMTWAFSLDCHDVIPDLATWLWKFLIIPPIGGGPIICQHDIR